MKIFLIIALFFSINQTAYALDNYSTDITAYYTEGTASNISPEQISNLMLFQAISSNDLVLFEELLNNGISANTRNEQFRTPIMMLNDAQLDFARLLMSHDAFINTRDRLGNTALIIASDKGYTELVRYFLASHSLVNAQNKDKLSAINFAVQKGHTDIVQLLLQNKASSTEKYPNGNSLIVEASKQGFTRIVEFLLQDGANVNDTITQTQTSLLGIASAYGSESLVSVLLKYKANINQQNTLGIPPLFLAVANQHYSIVELLLKHEADTSLTTKDGLSVFDFIQENDSKMKRIFHRIKK